QGSQHRVVGPDLQQRELVVRRRPGSRLGRRAHAGAADVRDHAAGPNLHRAARAEEDMMLEPRSERPVMPRITVETASTGKQTDAPVVFDLDGLEVFYGTFRAVRGVTMKIHKNEITAFIGPSGCGKTTVLRSFNRMHDVIPGARVG